MVEVLTIRACDQLKCIVGNEGDARTQINYNSIFPKLKQLEVSSCIALEYLFPAYAFRSPVYLESLKISKAPMLKYIFGISQHDDSLNPDNQNIQTLINFPALKDLSIGATGNKDCDKLKYLFSITISDILPELFSLEIKNAFELEHVLIKRDEMEEIVMKDVFAQRCRLFLTNLPNLISVCHGINFQEEDYYNVSNCPNFDTSTTYQADLEIGNSQVEEKVEEKLSSHMGEEIMTQQSLTVVEARAKGVSPNSLCQISLTSEKEVPTHTSLSLTELPTRDNTHACAKIFEEEEEEQGCLNTSRRLRSGIKASSSLSEDKLETSIDGVDHGDIKETCMVQNEYKSNDEPSSLTQREQESSYSKGQIQTKDQLTDSQPRSAMPTTHFVTISQDEYSEDELEGKVARNKRIKIDPHQSTMDTQNFTKDELVGKQVQKETIMMEPQSQQEMTRHDIHFHKEEEEEREDDIQLPIKSQSLAIDSSGSGNLVPNITHPINSLEGVNNEGINEASAVQNESKTNVTCHGDQANPSNITQIEQETSHSRGHMVESRDRTASDFIEDTKLSVSPFYTPIEMMPSFLETNNEASIVHGDAYLFGFDKDWIESIKTKVFDSGICEVDSIQKVLKGLDNDLKSNEAMLESIRDEEVEAARVVEVAQQEHVNVMARHAHLLKERQSIIARRHQCWEIIAARNRHFGF
ncbi:hypothetical protein K1719_029949 [Acacia pycnantha]|nr:hypothetical protein K1719_029949 [Acacia pycnantha]